MFDMKRREFIKRLGGTAVAWPLAARAQRAERMWRIGVLMAYGENDPEAKAQLSGFTQGLAELGWTDGRNIGMDVRWAAGNVDRVRTARRRHSSDLAACADAHLAKLSLFEQGETSCWRSSWTFFRGYRIPPGYCRNDRRLPSTNG
jgi:hypothetical protein